MISEKNTKQELLDEYKRLVSEAKSRKINVPADARSMNSKNTKSDIFNAIKKIDNILKVGVILGKIPEPEIIVFPVTPEVPEISEAPDNITKNTEHEEENDLNYLSQEIKDEIAALDTAKSIKKQEYDNLLIVEKELVKFVEMINDFKNRNFAQEEAHAKEENEVNALLEEKTEKAESENQERLENAKALIEATENDIQADKEKTFSERAVEEEKYTYDTAKKYKEEDDLWQDETARREEAIAGVKKETATLQAEIDSKAELVAELTAKIDEVPALLEKAKAEAAEAKEKELGKEYGYRKHMAQKDAEAAVQSLEKQIEHVKADYEAAMSEKNAIQSKLDKAYEESNKLYMQTVQSTGGIKILSNSDKN